MCAHTIHFIPEDRHASIEEIQIATDNTYHFITTISTKPNAMVILVTNTKVNLGTGWAGLKNNLDKIALLGPQIHLLPARFHKILTQWVGRDSAEAGVTLPQCIHTSLSCPR